MPRCPQCKKLMDSSETKCPFCGQPVEWEQKPRPKAVVEEGPVGRSGWMILLVVYLFANLINFIPVWNYLAGGERLTSALGALYLIYDVIMIVLFFIRSHYFRTMGIFTEVIHSIYLVAAFTTVVTAGVDMDVFRSSTLWTTAELLMSGLALGYYLRSKRVKNTFQFEG